MHSLPNQASLEFGERSKHMENQLARRTACLYRFHQIFKPNATLLEIVHDLHKDW